MKVSGRAMKVEAIKDDAGKRASAVPVEAAPTSNDDVPSTKPSSLAKLEESEISRLRAKVDELQNALDDRDSRRQQAEQALALTRRQFSKVLEQSAPLRQTASATMSNLEAFQAELVEAESGLSRTRHQLAITESALLQKQEENSQAWFEVSSISTRVAELEQLLRDQVCLSESIESELAEANSWAFKLAGERREAETALARAELTLRKECHARELAEQEAQALKSMSEAFKGELETSQVGCKLAEERRDEAYEEIVAITRFLRASESIATEQKTRLEWFERVTEVLNSKVPWWLHMFPGRWTRKWLLRRLATERLFDAGEYLRRYPDVRAAGQDPLRHYINHGIREGRHI